MAIFCIVAGRHLAIAGSGVDFDCNMVVLGSEFAVGLVRCIYRFQNLYLVYAASVVVDIKGLQAEADLL